MMIDDIHANTTPIASHPLRRKATGGALGFLAGVACAMGLIMVQVSGAVVDRMDPMTGDGGFAYLVDVLSPYALATYVAMFVGVGMLAAGVAIFRQAAIRWTKPHHDQGRSSS